MGIKPIRNDANYLEVLKEVEQLMLAVPDTSGGKKLDMMVKLIEAYETKYFAMDWPDPVETNLV